MSFPENGYERLALKISVFLSGSFLWAGAILSLVLTSPLLIAGAVLGRRGRK